MAIEFDEVGKKVSVKSIETFEAKLKHKLPADYKKFLQKNNGGIPSHDLSFAFREEGKDTETVIGEFYTLDSDSEDLISLHEAHHTFVASGRMPQDFLPFADDSFGNQLCLSLSQGQFGSVYFWNHEKEPDSSDATVEFTNLSLVAHSFDQFVAMLVAETE